MDVVRQRLDSLDKDIAKLTAEAKEAKQAWLSASDFQQRTDLKEVWLQLVKKEDVLLKERKALGVLLMGTGGPLDSGKGSSGVVPPEMVLFAEWVANAGEEDEDGRWLKLPEGVYFLGLPDLGSCLYIREAYRRLADVLEDLRADGKRHVVISGNPGIGKSWFAIWMLVRWLRKGADVLWHTSTNTFFYYRNGTVSVLSGAEANYVLRTERELRYIVDGATPLVDLVVKQSLVAHSPDNSKYKEYLKIIGAASSPLYMPFWEEEELDIVRSKLHPAVSKEQMNQMIARRGAVPRYVLDKGTDDQMDKWIEAAVSNLTSEDIITAVPGSARASHRIAAIHPKDWRAGNFADYELRFLSVAVKDLVTRRMLKVVTGGLPNLMFLVNKSATAPAADLGSCIEESIVHALLKEGGKWLLRKCPPPV